MALGVDLGNNLIKESEADNPTGFWEDADILTLSNRVLEALGRSWETVLPMDEKSFDALGIDSLVQDGADLLSKKIVKGQCFGFKNPRTGPLLPYWKRVFSTLDVEAKYLFAIRNPASVVQSLNARNGLPSKFGYALWTSNVLDTLNGLGGETVTFLSYENIMANPEAELRRVASAINLNWDEQNVKDFSQHFVSQHLYHHHHKILDLMQDKACYPQTLKLYMLLSEHSGSELSNLMKATAVIYQAWYADLRKFEYLEEIAKVSIEADDLRSGLNELETIIQGYETTILGLLNSSRWRLANMIGEVKRKILFQPKPPMAEESIRELREQFQEWRSRRID